MGMNKKSAEYILGEVLAAKSSSPSQRVARVVQACNEALSGSSSKPTSSTKVADAVDAAISDTDTSK